MSHIPAITVIAHVYYPFSWALIKQKCADILTGSENILISSCYDDVIKEIDEERAIIFKVSNLGKDIGGKLVSLKYYLEFCKKTELVIFLHDKISPQTINSTYWFDKLYEIFESDKFHKALTIFKKNDKVGMIGSNQFKKNEYIKSTGSFDTTNSDIILACMKEYKIYSSEYDFIAGSIFIVRSLIYETYFREVNPLQVRSLLEPGNVLDLSHGTYTHTWERLLSFIVSSQNYRVKGI